MELFFLIASVAIVVIAIVSVVLRKRGVPGETTQLSTEAIRVQHQKATVAANHTPHHFNR